MNHNNILLLVSISVTITLLSSCSAIKLKPGAERVLVSKNPSPTGCKFVGMITGSQGNAFSGGWTSNRNLSTGALNDIRNQALSLGANYVQIESDRAGNTLSGGGFMGSGSMSGSQTDVTISGNAFRCDPDKLGI